MKISHPTQVSRSRSQHLITEDDLKKIFPYTQQQHNRYLLQNRLTNVKESISNEQQQSISSHIKELIQKDKVRPRFLHPINLLDESILGKEQTSKDSIVRDSIVRDSIARTKLQYHDSQNINLHTKSQRREMVQLAQWLDLMVQQLHQLNLTDYQDFYNRLEVIYSGSILEMQRQLGISGFEFGEFLKKLWESFIDQIQKIIDGLSKRNQQIEQQGFEEINKLHIWYQDAIQKQTTAVQSMKEELQSVQTAIKKLKKENVYFRKKDNRRERIMHELMHQIEHQNVQLIELQGTNDFQVAENANEIELELQQKEIFQYFRNQFDVHRKQFEHNYKSMLEQDEFYEVSRDIILQDQTVDTSDLIKVRDANQDTTDFCSFQTTSTQTPKPKKMIDEEIMVQPLQVDQITQVSYFMVKRDRVARNIVEQRLLKKSKNPIMNVVEEYNKFYFPEQELSSNNPQFVSIIEEQMLSLQDRSNELFSLLSMRAEIQSEDIDTLKQYYQINYQNFTNYFNSVWGILQNQVSAVIDAKIDKEELEVDIADIEKRFYSNLTLLKKFHAKTKQKETIIKFFEKSLIKVIRYAPQFLINQVKEEGQQFGVLQHIDLKELKKRGGTIQDPKTLSPLKGSTNNVISQEQRGSMKDIKELGSSQTGFNKSQTRLSQNSSRQQSSSNLNVTNTAIKFVQKLKRTSSIPEIDDDDNDNYKSESSKDNSSDESDVSLANIILDLQANQPQLSIEKKLRINTCPLKSATYSTNVLKHIIHKFNHNDRSGLLKLSTILQNYQEFILKIQNTTQQAPMHVHIYENIVSHYGQSQFSDGNRFKRTLKSFLFYQNQHSTCKLVVQFLKAEYDVQDLTLYLSILNTLQEYPNVLYVKFNDAIIKMLQNNEYNPREIDEIMADISTSELSYIQAMQGPVEYDLIMLHFLKIFQKYKNRTSSKYKYLFQAVDYKNKARIDFSQWTYIYGTLCQLNAEFALKLFYQEADYQDETGKTMSKQRFTLISDELKLFQQDQQDALLDSEKFQDILEKINRLWNKEKIMMKMTFIKASRYDKFIKGMFSIIDTYIISPNKCSVEPESICYMYKLLHKTYKPFYLEAQIPLGLPVEFILINQETKRLQIKQLMKD